MTFEKVNYYQDAAYKRPISLFSRKHNNKKNDVDTQESLLYFDM